MDIVNVVLKSVFDFLSFSGLAVDFSGQHNGKFECHVLVATEGTDSEGVVSSKSRSSPLRNILA